MKTGCSVFLVAFVALGASWFGLVRGPLHQLGTEKQTAVLQSDDAWPPQRTGDATLGLDVYREYGCAACHTRQIRQTGVANELDLVSLGQHQAADFKDFLKSLMVVPELSSFSNTLCGPDIEKWDGRLPYTLYFGPDDTVVAALAQKLKPLGIKTDARVVATGADISHGWGLRQSVAADYLYDQPVELGSLRAGPDLTMTGARQPDLNWQLQHLYAPRSVNPRSTMPAFRFLFEVRPISGQPAPDALSLKGEFAPPAGMEVVPTPEARHLAAYLLSLKAGAPLYEAPYTPVTAAK
jgi:cbb3-type cytochrome oxidase cytochrome c subunit